MSESQKMFASVSGAFVAHLMLLVLVLVLPETTSVGSSATGKKSRERPREVTVMMGDLMERLERERLEKKPDPPEPEPPRPESRAFVSTDLNRAEAEAPENARFESDRNTTAASRLRPDENLPQERGLPTLAGTSPLPHLTLANRDYTKGPMEESSGAAASGAAAPALPAPPAPPPPSTGGMPAAPMPVAPMPAARNAETLSASEEGPRPEGAASDAAMAAIPGNQGTGSEGATREKSYLPPDRDVPSPLIREVPDGADRLAVGDGSGREGKDPSDPLASPTQQGAMAAATDGLRESVEETAAPPEREPPAPMTRPADDGLFAKGFSPEERQNVINGTFTRAGTDAVDAIGTPMGKYKKAVRDAISAKWHQYRQKNADFVTWGILKLEFSVDARGKVHDLQITKNEANAMLAEFSLRAIREAELPPMPAEVAESVGSKGLVIQYDIIIY
jgi:hypothetical protein